MSKLIYFVGCPASGKSTAAQKIRLRRPLTTFIINRDDIRRELHPFGKYPFYKYSKENEQEVTEFQYGRIADFLAADNADNTVISDDTNLNEKTVASLEKIANTYNAEIERIEIFDVPLHKLLERDYKRQHPVGPSVIKRFFKKQMEIQGRVIKPVDGLLECVIVDVDNTVAFRHDRSPYDWHLVHQDKPNKAVIEMVRFWAENTGPDPYNWKPIPRIIFLSGRDSVCKPATQEWLENYVMYTPLGCGGDYIPFELYMRAEGDSRPDSVIKEELLREHVLPNYNVKLVVDDRVQMCDHWWALGLQVWKVNEGDF